jgi:hypothetical protein
MATEFATLAEAIEAGYESPGRAGRVLEEYREYNILVSDESGPGAFGYDFAVSAVPNEEKIRQGHRSLGPFGATVTVDFTEEPNKLGKPGSFTAMFPPGILDEAIAEAKEAVDAAHQV